MSPIVSGSTGGDVVSSDETKAISTMANYFEKRG